MTSTRELARTAPSTSALSEPAPVTDPLTQSSNLEQAGCFEMSASTTLAPSREPQVVDCLPLGSAWLKMARRLGLVAAAAYVVA
jgi:hypothetical protein